MTDLCLSGRVPTPFRTAAGTVVWRQRLRGGLAHSLNAKPQTRHAWRAALASVPSAKPARKTRRTS